ncbi:MAG: sigma-70 family RNA polymerase sigma factor [Candidatus Omnitrophota bacterium]
MTLTEAKANDCVRRLQGGERAAFDELIQAYKHKAYGVVYRIVGNVEDAQDVLQEAFLRAYANIGQFRGEARFSTWLYRILINLARDALRKKIRTRRFFDPKLERQDQEQDVLANMPDGSMNPRQLALEKEKTVLLQRAVTRLSEKQRLAFCLKYFEGHSTEEVAFIMHCRPATVKVHLFRASQALQRALGFYAKQ